MDRRSFCYLGLMGLLAFGIGCQPDEGGKDIAPGPKESNENGKTGDDRQETASERKEGGTEKMSRIAVIATTSREKGVRKSLELLEEELDIGGKRVLVKPNFNTADPVPGSTHNDTLQALLRELKQRGASSLVIGERSGPPLPTEEVMKKKGIFHLAEKEGAEILNFERLQEKDFFHFKEEGLHWKNGFLVPRAVREAEAVVSTCCLKTHAFGGVFTLALKLAVGMVPRRGFDFMSELHGSPHIRKMIAEINLAFDPQVTVLDGIEAFVGGGPATGKRKRGDLFLAGGDRVALDAVGVAALKHLGSNPQIMETPIFEQEQIVCAARLGLGAASPREIELVPAEDEKSRALAAALRSILDLG